MAVSALTNLSKALKDVDELISAHASLTGGGKGAPAQRQGAAVSRAAVVLTCAALEQFIEDLFEEAADVVFAGWTDVQKKQFLDQTVKRFNNADVFKTNYLYFNLGLPWVYDAIAWQKFTNGEVTKAVNSLVNTRNQIAHGKRPSTRLADAKRWRLFVDNLGPRFRKKVSDEIKRVHNKGCGW